MSKYTPLAQHLRDQVANEVRLTFDQVAEIIAAPLPQSAFNHREWWANDKSGYHSWATEWMDAGWICDTVSLSEQWVRFKRVE